MFKKVECYICNTKTAEFSCGIMVKGGFFSKEFTSTCPPCYSVLQFLTVDVDTRKVLNIWPLIKKDNLLAEVKLKDGGPDSIFKKEQWRSYYHSLSKKEIESNKDDIIKLSKRIILDEKRREELIEKYGEDDGKRIIDDEISEEEYLEEQKRKIKEEEEEEEQWWEEQKQQEKQQEKRQKLLKKEIIKLLKKHQQKMPASDIDAHLKHQNVDEIKELCEEMYHDGKISRTGNYRYFVLTK